MTYLSRRKALAAAGAGLAAIAVPAAAPAQAQSRNPIRLGFSMALTGGLAVGGRAALLAFQIWADEINAAGGLLGRRVDLVYYDDQTNPALVPGIYAKLLDVDKVDLVLSGYGTVATVPAMPLIVQRGKLFLSLLAIAANDELRYDRYFQMQPQGPAGKVEFSKGFFELAAGLDPQPKTVALVGADAEFSALAVEGARENARKMGLRIVYDRSYPPATVDFTPVVRAIKATNPELLFIGSYPPDSAGMIRSIHEVGFAARMAGGGMIGLQFAAIKQQLGAMLNNIVAYDLYVPEPTMRFPGVEAFLAKYRERAVPAGIDPLGLYVPPFAYAEMQILEAAVKAVGAIDDKRLADHIRATRFATIVGDIKFGDRGEWAEPRILFVQYRGIAGNGIEQFKEAGKQVILHPARYKSGDLHVPFEPVRR
jgi:branched-chain amino acid transport system substrate-binding protein